MPRWTPHFSSAAGSLLAVATLALSGCEAPPASPRWSVLVLDDALADGTAMVESQHARAPAHWRRAAVLRAPLLAYAPTLEPGAAGVLQPASSVQLPVLVLLRVEIRLLPAVDCSTAPSWLMDSRDFARLQPMQPQWLDQLGTPEAAREAWIVPAYVVGARPNAPIDSADRARIVEEARLSGDRFKPDQVGVTGSAFDFGPPWLGLPLRLAGPAAEVLFPPSLDCAGNPYPRADTLPRRGFAQWAHRDDYIEVAQNRPFLAKVIEACPVELHQQEEFFTIAGRWPWMPRQDRWRYTGELRARCASGELHHRSEPIVISSALGTRRLSDAYRIDVDRAPPPVW